MEVDGDMFYKEVNFIVTISTIGKIFKIAVENSGKKCT